MGDWDGILIVSGDGLVYEVVNGLMSRADGAAFLASVPLGVIPGGSGNGLAATLCSQEGVPLKRWIQARTLAAAAPTATLPLPLIRIQTPKAHSHAFLSLSWGVLADIGRPLIHPTLSLLVGQRKGL